MDMIEAYKLAKQLMTEHGLIQSGWQFEFDNARRRFGLCLYDAKVISLSAYLVKLNPESEVRETILHEIAHALAPRAEHHGPQWRRIAQSIGCTGNRCHDAVTVAPNWIGTCPNCGLTIERHRLKESTKRVACKNCCDRYNNGHYSTEYMVVWTRA